MIGALFSGQLADIIGRRWTLVVALTISFAAITVEFIATTNEVFFAGKFLNGFAVGTIQATSSTYIGEVCLHPCISCVYSFSHVKQIVPLALRGLVTCLIALSYTVGPFTVALIVNTTGNYTTRWAYRAVFCSQYGFAGISAIFVWFMPE